MLRQSETQSPCRAPVMGLGKQLPILGVAPLCRRSTYGTFAEKISCDLNKTSKLSRVVRMDVEAVSPGRHTSCCVQTLSDLDTYSVLPQYLGVGISKWIASSCSCLLSVIFGNQMPSTSCLEFSHRSRPVEEETND